jgi:hypothetical protein
VCGNKGLARLGVGMGCRRGRRHGCGGCAGESIGERMGVGAQLMAGPQRGHHYAIAWPTMGRSGRGGAAKAADEHEATVSGASAAARCSWVCVERDSKKKGQHGEEIGEGGKRSSLLGRGSSGHDRLGRGPLGAQLPRARPLGAPLTYRHGPLGCGRMGRGAECRGRQVRRAASGSRGHQGAMWASTVGVGRRPLGCCLVHGHGRRR